MRDRGAWNDLDEAIQRLADQNRTQLEEEIEVERLPEFTPVHDRRLEKQVLRDASSSSLKAGGTPR